MYTCRTDSPLINRGYTNTLAKLTVVVVAIPEGLPLAVTLALALANYQDDCGTI